MNIVELVLDLRLQTEAAIDLLTRFTLIEQDDKPKVLAIDMDDTLLKYVRGGGYGAPLPGMIALLKQLRAKGWKIAIWTCRKNEDRVKEKLKEKGVPYDYVNDNPHGKDNDDLRKIHADVYLDDKAITATGNADGLLDKILNFQSWSKREREEKKKESRQRRKESIDEDKAFKVAKDPATGGEFWCDKGTVWLSKKDGSTVNQGTLQDFLAKFKRGGYHSRIKLEPGIADHESVTEDAPPGVKVERIKRKGFMLSVWENPHVAPDSDGQWQGTYQRVDGGWGETKPTDRYGYASKAEILKHLDTLVMALWKSHGKGSSTAPYRLGESLLPDLQKATKGLNIKDMTWALNRIQGMTDGGGELEKYANLGTVAYGLNWALASGRLTMEAEKYIKSLDLKGLLKLLETLTRRCHVMNDVVSFMNNNRWTESIVEAHDCHAFNPNTGVCETGCPRSGIDQGQACPWSLDWAKAEKNPESGGCACYG